MHYLRQLCMNWRKYKVPSFSQKTFHEVNNKVVSNDPVLDPKTRGAGSKPEPFQPDWPQTTPIAAWLAKPELPSNVDLEAVSCSV